jgi:hypothetical protein
MVTDERAKRRGGEARWEEREEEWEGRWKVKSGERE